MTTGLALNPFLELHARNEELDEIFLIAPRPGRGTLRFVINRGANPELYALFVETPSSQYHTIDVDLDLSDSDRELLYSYGVVVDQEALPEKTLFSCLLDSVEGSEPRDSSQLIVNPTLNFRSLDFSNLITRIQSDHLSGRPSVWVAEEFNGIERGYWFDKLADAEIVSKFEPGKPASVDIEPVFLTKLYAAQILTTQAEIDERTQTNRTVLDNAREKYVRDKYCVIEELLPAEQMAAMRMYYRKYIANGFMPFEDPQAVRYYQHNEPFARVFHKQLTKLMSYIVGEEVIPSYVYAGSYVDNADLKPHCDREQCEFSISFQVDYQPEQPEHRSPWGLFVRQPDWTNDVLEYHSEEFPAASEAEDRNPGVYLRSGDGLIYKGRELIHYRYPLQTGHQSTSLFFHYVPKDFDGDLR